MFRLFCYQSKVFICVYLCFFDNINPHKDTRILCLAPDSDLHWICDCPCPALKEPRDTLLHETIPAHLRQLLVYTEKQQERLLPQLSDLCRALRTGLSNSPHRELLWKGAWTTNLIASLADTARANTRNNPWRSPTAIALLVKTLKNFGALTTNYVLNASKIRRRAAFQIHQKINTWATPSFFDHVPRLPHIDSIKYMEPALTEDQLQIILNKLLRLNPARPDLANRTFGRRRRRLYQLLQPPPEPNLVTTERTPETNFTIPITLWPQQRPTLSLIASLPYCVCCLCGYDHVTPDCPPRTSLPTSLHTCQLQTTHVDPDTPAPQPQALLTEQDWSALHWDI